MILGKCIYHNSVHLQNITRIRMNWSIKNENLQNDFIKNMPKENINTIFFTNKYFIRNFPYKKKKNLKSKHIGKLEQYIHQHLYELLHDRHYKRISIKTNFTKFNKPQHPLILTKNIFDKQKQKINSDQQEKEQISQNKRVFKRGSQRHLLPDHLQKVYHLYLDKHHHIYHRNNKFSGNSSQKSQKINNPPYHFPDHFSYFQSQQVRQKIIISLVKKITIIIVKIVSVLLIQIGQKIIAYLILLKIIYQIYEMTIQWMNEVQQQKKDKIFVQILQGVVTLIEGEEDDQDDLDDEDEEQQQQNQDQKQENKIDINKKYGMQDESYKYTDFEDQKYQINGIKQTVVDDKNLKKQKKIEIKNDNKQAKILNKNSKIKEEKHKQQHNNNKLIRNQKRQQGKQKNKQKNGKQVKNKLNQKQNDKNFNKKPTKSKQNVKQIQQRNIKQVQNEQTKSKQTKQMQQQNKKLQKQYQYSQTSQFLIQI